MKRSTSQSIAPLVPIVAAELRVAVGRLHLDDPLADLEERHVERAAAEVEDEDRLLRLLLVKTVGQGGRGRLVDDPEDLEPGDLPRLLRGLALRVVEVRGHGHDGLRHGVPEVGLRVPLQLREDLGGDLLGLQSFPSIETDQSLAPMCRLTDRTVGPGS